MKSLSALIVLIGMIIVFGLYFVFTVLYFIYGVLTKDFSLLVGGLVLVLFWVFILNPKSKLTLTD
jgi:hypothetical protein